MDNVRVIVGLGNPGSSYENTRHNIGFAVIDAVAHRVNIKLSEGNGEYMIGSGQTGSKKIILVKPLTYMNNSGTAVRQIIESIDINLFQLLVVMDDFNIPLGKIRLRKYGSSGGHNGLYSIIYHLNSEEFPRLRCGIGVGLRLEEKSKTSDFVLSCFAPDEMKIVQRLILAAQEAILTAVTEGFKTASNRYNNIQV